MYGLSNKKNVNEQFARQKCHHTLLSRQRKVDEWANLGLQEIDASPGLHHSMASQMRKDNVFSLPLYLSQHVYDPAVMVSEGCVQPPHSYMSSSQILCHA